VTTVQSVSREELVGRASSLIPLLQKHALWTEENRRLHDETIEAMADAGIFKMRIPARYGGYESDTRTVVDVATELGRGDGSAAWNASVWLIPGWIVGMFSDDVQDEIYATPDVRVCGTLSPSASAEPTDGGIVVTGRWGFISGARHSHWQLIIAMSVTPAGVPEPVMALVPMSELKIVDDWYTSGLRGSGSVTTVADRVFVPAERVLPVGAVMRQESRSVLNGTIPMYQVPMMAVAAACSVGNVVGLAKAARDCFFERLPGRRITYTAYESQREAPITHLQVGEATVNIDEAEFHARRIADLVDEKAVTGAPWSVEERAMPMGATAAVCKRSMEAVDILNAASGGSSIYSNVPIQRITRDIHALAQHALHTPHILFETYGRVLCGLEPNSVFF
jgi:alkylation response protein AidB-like acyl-CoA dehydrogenase